MPISQVEYLLTTSTVGPPLDLVHEQSIFSQNPPIFGKDNGGPSFKSPATIRPDSPGHLGVDLDKSSGAAAVSSSDREPPYNAPDQPGLANIDVGPTDTVRRSSRTRVAEIMFATPFGHPILFPTVTLFQ